MFTQQRIRQMATEIVDLLGVHDANGHLSGLQLSVHERSHLLITYREQVIGLLTNAIAEESKVPREKRKPIHGLAGYYTAEEIAERFSLSVDDVASWCGSQQMPHYNLCGKGPFFRLEEVTAWLKDELVHRVVAIPAVRSIRVLDFVTPPKSSLGHVVPAELAAIPNLLEVPCIHMIPGVYFLCRGNELVYIGSSVNVISRVGQHVHEGFKEFTHVFYLPTPVNQMRGLEGELAKQLRPEYNIDKNGQVKW